MSIDKHLAEEFRALDDYFSETTICNNRWNNKLLCKAVEFYGDFSIQINLINTAPFSTLKPDDKECHYFPQEQLHSLVKQDNMNICFTVMHHGIEWFDWSCKSDLEKAVYDNSEFLLTGHDHVGSGRVVSFSNDSGVWVSAAGAIDFSQYVHNDSFNLIVIDTQTNCFSSFMYTWKPVDRLFYQETIADHCEINSKSHCLQPRASIIKEIKADSRRISNEFTEYLVFPRLSCESHEAYKKHAVFA